jgi:multiple sugar transport system permease protein
LPIILVLAAVLYPLLWMFAASFRPNFQVFNSLGFLAKNPTIQNYLDGWRGGSGIGFSTYFGNSLLICFFAILGNLFACSCAAYAFARLDFPFKRFLFAMLLATLLLPYQVTLIPQYILFNEIGWVGTYLPLIVPRWLGVDAFYVFLMVQFIRGLPRELDEAARIDGAGPFRIFRMIILPLSLPAIGTTALFTFVNTWNDFLGPLLYVYDPESKTITQGLAAFIDVTGESFYGSLFAMCSVSLAPLVAFFLASQRLLVDGIATTGLK